MRIVSPSFIARMHTTAIGYLWSFTTNRISQKSMFGLSLIHFAILLNSNLNAFLVIFFLVSVAYQQSIFNMVWISVCAILYLHQSAYRFCQPQQIESHRKRVFCEIRFPSVIVFINCVVQFSEVPLSIHHQYGMNICVLPPSISL